MRARASPPRRVAADDRNARLGDPLVELDDVGEARVAAGAERDDQAVGRRAGRGEVAEVDGGRPEAELAPRDPVEAEVDALDERVLRHDGAGDLRGVVLDPLDEAAALELGEQAELADVSKTRHRRRARTPRWRLARTTATPVAPASMHAAAFRVDPADRDDRNRDGVADRASPSSPIGGSASGFVGVAQTGPAPM